MASQALSELGLETNILKREYYNLLKSYGWFLKTTTNFLKTQSLFDEENIGAVTLDFVNLPMTMRSFSEYDSVDLVKRDISALGRTHDLLLIIFHGRQVYISAEKHVFEQHAAGKSWAGDFTAEDIYIIQFTSTDIKCHIRAKSNTIPCTSDNKVLDIKQIHKSMADKYQFNGNFPAHFECLEKDINSLTAVSLDTSSILTYLPYHAAFMPPGANEAITQKLHDATEGVWMEPDEFQTYRLLFESNPVDGDDWRLGYCKSTDPLLKKVYLHDYRTAFQNIYGNTGVQLTSGNTARDHMQAQLTPDNTEAQLTPDNTEAQLTPDNTKAQLTPDNTQAQQSQGSSSTVKGVTPDNMEAQLTPDNTKAQLTPDNTQAQQSQGSSSTVKGTGAGNKFNKSRKSKLSYKRHLNVHIHTHMKGQRPLRGLYQAELYSAKKNPVLGEIFTELFNGPTMKLPKFFGPMWELYCAARDAQVE
ncbi:uncharacterized protein LOC119275144 isoform X1 [Triticum dicoccoides]|uniref:uncharacterized protein LOC119275144 isoform X1 n=2 Tax=Triticum dicoccoides TaxID=85692 RepID=UPI0018908B63|nr:uncharacterized protein LOC119275144 isoform X1 [Triticum dicoccoides]